MTEADVDFRAQLRAWCAEAEVEREVQARERLDRLAVERATRSKAGLVEAERSFVWWERRAGRLPGLDAPTLPGL